MNGDYRLRECLWNSRNSDPVLIDDAQSSWRLPSTVVRWMSEVFMFASTDMGVRSKLVRIDSKVDFSCPELVEVGVSSYISWEAGQFCINYGGCSLLRDSTSASAYELLNSVCHEARVMLPRSPFWRDPAVFVDGKKTIWKVEVGSLGSMRW